MTTMLTRLELPWWSFEPVNVSS